MEPVPVHGCLAPLQSWLWQTMPFLGVYLQDQVPTGFSESMTLELLIVNIR